MLALGRLMIRAAVSLAKTVFVDINERANFLKDTDLAEKIFTVLISPAPATTTAGPAHPKRCVRSLRSRACALQVLADASQPNDVRVWAVEGTAYLSIFGEYKDRIAHDAKLMDSLFSLVKVRSLPSAPPPFLSHTH